MRQVIDVRYMNKKYSYQQSAVSFEYRPSNIGLAMSRFKKIFSPRTPHPAPRSSGLFSLFFHNVERRTLSIERSQKGFTSVELIIVMLVLAMLTVSFVIKNPFSIQDYSSIAADQLIADIRYVQMRAMGVGSSQNITFTINSGIYNTAGEQKNLPQDVQVINTNFGGTYANQLKFNSLGEPFVGTNVSCATLSGGNCTVDLTTNKRITIYAITGKVE